jgi:hypothetical protein
VRHSGGRSFCLFGRPQASIDSRFICHQRLPFALERCSRERRQTRFVGPAPLAASDGCGREHTWPSDICVAARLREQIGISVTQTMVKTPNGVPRKFDHALYRCEFAYFKLDDMPAACPRRRRAECCRARAATPRRLGR